MVSGNPFAADSDVWKAASTPSTPEAAHRTRENSSDPFALPQRQSGYGEAPLGVQQGTVYPPSQPAPDNFADLNPTAFARAPRKQQQGVSGATRLTAGQSYEQASAGANSGFTSQASTPKGKFRQTANYAPQCQ